MVNQFVNFLDFWDIFTNELVGSVILFIIISIIIFLYFAIKNNLDWRPMLLLLMFMVLIFYAKVGDTILGFAYVIIVLVSFTIAFLALRKAIKPQ